MRPKRRVAAAAALSALLVALVLVSEGVHRALLQGMQEAERIAAVHPVYAMALIVAFSAVAAMVAFVSSWVVVPFAVFTWGPTVALVLLWSGWLLGGAASYAIGRFLGRPAVRWLVPRRLLTRYEEHVSRHTPFSLVLLVQFVLPSEIPGYLLGLVRYSFGRYLVALGLVELAYGVVTVYVGRSVLERRIVPILAGLAALALAGAWAARMLPRRLARDASSATDGHDEQRRGRETVEQPLGRTADQQAVHEPFPLRPDDHQVRLPARGLRRDLGFRRPTPHRSLGLRHSELLREPVEGLDGLPLEELPVGSARHHPGEADRRDDVEDP